MNTFQTRKRKDNGYTWWHGTNVLKKNISHLSFSIFFMFFSAAACAWAVVSVIIYLHSLIISFFILLCIIVCLNIAIYIILHMYSDFVESANCKNVFSLLIFLRVCQVYMQYICQYQRVRKWHLSKEDGWREEWQNFIKTHSIKIKAADIFLSEHCVVCKKSH